MCSNMIMGDNILIGFAIIACVAVAAMAIIAFIKD